MCGCGALWVGQKWAAHVLTVGLRGSLVPEGWRDGGPLSIISCVRMHASFARSRVDVVCAGQHKAVALQTRPLIEDRQHFRSSLLLALLQFCERRHSHIRPAQGPCTHISTAAQALSARVHLRPHHLCKNAALSPSKRMARSPASALGLEPRPRTVLLTSSPRAREAQQSLRGRTLAEAPSSARLTVGLRGVVWMGGGAREQAGVRPCHSLAGIDYRAPARVCPSVSRPGAPAQPPKGTSKGHRL